MLLVGPPARPTSDGFFAPVVGGCRVPSVPILAIGSEVAFAIDTLLSLVLLVLAVVAMLAVIKLPALLERIASDTAQLQQSLREVIAEIRQVTTQS